MGYPVVLWENNAFIIKTQKEKSQYKMNMELYKMQFRGEKNVGILKEREGYFFSNRELKRLVVPLIIEQFLAILVGLADSMMVSSVGESAVSGVSLVDTIFILLINIFAALSTGGAVVCGQYIGKKMLDKGCKSAEQLVLFTAVFSLVVMGLVYLCKPFILNVVFGTIEPEVMGHSNTYLMIVAASIPFIALYNAGAAIFRVMGNAKIAMYMSLIMNGLHIVGNAILLYGLHWGVEGAAIPTLFSRMLAGVAMIVLLFNPKLPIHLSRPFVFRFHIPTLKKILHIGVPNGLENSMFQLGKIMVLSMVASCGTASIAANAVSNTIASIQVLPGQAMGFAILSVTAQCAGAGDFTQVKYYAKKLLLVAYSLMLITSLGIIALLPAIMKVYGISPEATQLAMKILTYHGLCCITIWPLSFALPNALRASNDVRFCMWLSIISMWVFRIGFSYLLCIRLEIGVFGVWVAMTIDWLVRAICFSWRYLRGKWMYKVD